MNSKVTLKFPVKISLISIISVFLFADLITLGYFQSPIYTLIQYISLLIVGIFAILQIRYIKFQDVVFLLGALLMGLCIVISSYFNKVNPDALRGSIYYAALLFIMCAFLIEAGNQKALRQVLLGGKVYLMIVLLLNDFLMVAIPNTFYNISGRDIGTTLLGNKFNVSYSHLMLMFILVFLEERLKNRNKKIIVYAVLLSILCLYVECSTTLLACWVFVILYFLPENLKEFISKPIVFIIVFFLGAFLLLSFSGILSWGPIKYLIENILHRDATLTGRMQVYPYIYRLVSRQRWWGYGYGTDIVMKTSIWYANAQNALWDFVICYGFITTASLIIYMMFSVNRYSKCTTEKFRNSSWLIFEMVYVYIFMGIGEITYSKQFFFYIALLWSVSSIWKKQRKVRKTKVRK